MGSGENSFNWEIPESVLSGGAYVVSVSINRFNPNFDYSDETFSVFNP